VSALLRAGEVVAASGVGRETLRYYERRGLIAPDARTLGGHRLYPAAVVERLRAIKAAQRLGFTLDEITDLLDLTRRSSTERGLQDGARAKLAQVHERIAELKAVAALLEGALSAGCEDLHACLHNPACPVPFTEPALPAPTTRH
jgi:MerR family mercuric resistance operon transcriptional regulator